MTERLISLPALDRKFGFWALNKLGRQQSSIGRTRSIEGWDYVSALPSTEIKGLWSKN